MTMLTQAQYAELEPLARSIADTIHTTRHPWGDVNGLAASIAVSVAVYMGPLVGPVPTEMAALREQVEQARRIAVALEQENAELIRVHDETSPWQRTVDGLNALTAADIPFHIELDGAIANPSGPEVIGWDRDRACWVLGLDGDDL